jgi:GPH family glycoside/pentoside/hexuronide:cation symporter
VAICLIYTVGNTCYWQLMPSMIYDVCEADELASGQKRAGQVISLQALSESLSTAVAAQMLGIVLQLAGFHESTAAQSDTALTWISHNYTLVPGICMILMAVVILFHPINKASFRRIREALARRDRGEHVDLGEFRDVYGHRFLKAQQKRDR